MAATTPVYQLPYPSAADPADVPADMQRLADRVEVAIAPGSSSGQVLAWDNVSKTWKAAAAPTPLPTPTAAQQVPVWSGSAWVAQLIRSAQIDPAAGILGSQLAADTITAAQIAANAIGASELADNSVDAAAIAALAVGAGELADGAVTSAKIADGTIVNADVAAAAGIEGPKLAWHVGTAPPASPSDNMIWIYDGGAFYWMFVYDSGEPTYRWKFVGGSPVFAEIDTQQSLATANAWSDLATVGPLVSIARAGVYNVWTTCLGNCSSVNGYTMAGPAAGAAGSGSYGQMRALDANEFESLPAMDQLTVAAGSDIRLRYYQTLGTSNFSYRKIMVEPVRVS
jgi:hypothetical protein